MPGRFASWLITINFTHQLNSGRNLVRRNKNRKVLFMAHIFYTACCRPSRIGSENCEFPASFFANFAFLFPLSLTSTFGIGNNKKNYERRSFRTDSVLFLHFVVRKNQAFRKTHWRRKHNTHIALMQFLSSHFTSFPLLCHDRTDSLHGKTSELGWFRRDWESAPSQPAPAKRQKKRKRLHNPGVLSSRNGKSFPFT